MVYRQWCHISMPVTSQLPIQTTKIFYSFLTCICVPPLWKRFRHPCHEVRYSKLVRQKQLRKALLLVLLSVDDYKRLDSSSCFIFTSFRTELKPGVNVSHDMNSPTFTLYTQPWSSEGFFPEGGTRGFFQIVSRGGKSGKIYFFPLKIKKTTIFCIKFQNPGGPWAPAPLFRRPCTQPWSSEGEGYKGALAPPCILKFDIFLLNF